MICANPIAVRAARMTRGVTPPGVVALRERARQRRMTLARNTLTVFMPSALLVEGSAAWLAFWQAEDGQAVRASVATDRRTGLGESPPAPAGGSR